MFSNFGSDILDWVAPGTWNLNPFPFSRKIAFILGKCERKFSIFLKLLIRKTMFSRLINS
jgi:hypothetical protein